MSKRFYWMDHFIGDQIQDEWFIAAGTGTAVVVDGVAGGIVRLTTGAGAASNCYMAWGNFGSLMANRNEAIEYRIKVIDIDPNTHQVEWGYRDVSGSRTNAFYVTLSTDVFLRASTHDGVAGATVPLLMNLDANYHIYRIDTHTLVAIHSHYYVDGVEGANSPKSTNIPIGALCTPWIYIKNVTDPKALEVDYVAARQDR